MIMGHKKTYLEHEMIRTIGLTLLVLAWSAGLCLVGAQAPHGKLIPVQRAEQPEPQVQEEAPDQAATSGYALPAPKDQLYVFWVLGRILSFPVDLAESIIRKRRSHAQHKEGSAVQASSPVNGNPFENLNWREIPPAPPVSDTRGH